MNIEIYTLMAIKILFVPFPFSVLFICFSVNIMSGNFIRESSLLHSQISVISSKKVNPGTGGRGGLKSDNAGFGRTISRKRGEGRE